MDMALNRAHDKWLEDNREYPRIEAMCDECGSEIYVDEDHYNIEGFIVCQDCLTQFAKKHYLIRGEC